ncbi:nucleotide pyrophosphohydrolase [Sulfuricurvum sp. IAE1]|uniref:nucleotide pyrophosphohydrolase n=1 Tax=Sulfuricurvum sp. IAE1 TaxID=2546102 RepID=UPI00104A0355|nr:nucleotide pyrophosphohydrolase [Sulfuricurvum sp. IAE1]TDA67370.1 nucleotide pyrophosphohydrolase [Sulfuricurvum sp. IAE1]
MNLEHIQSIITRFSSERGWEKHHSPKNLVMALSGEVGELNEIFQWLSEEESQNLPDEVREHTQEEIADIAVYLIRLCMKLEIDLEAAIVDKMAKNEAKYPIDRVKGMDKKRLFLAKRE